MGLFDFKKKPDASRRIIFGQLESKSEIKAHLERLKRSFPGVGFSMQRVGKEFWVVAPEGATDSDMLGYNACVSMVLTMRGKRFSRIHDDEMGGKCLTLDEGATAPVEPPVELTKGPYLIIIGLLRKDQVIDQWELRVNDWSAVCEESKALEESLELGGTSIKELRKQGYTIIQQIQKE